MRPRWQTEHTAPPWSQRHAAARRTSGNGARRAAGFDRLAASRAGATFATITGQRVYDRRHHLFGRRTARSIWRYEELWPFCNAWAAICALSSLPDQAAASAVASDLLDGVGHYARPSTQDGNETTPIGFGVSVVSRLPVKRDVFFDDNAWLGLAMLHQHRLTGNPRLLALAQRVFTFITSGWSVDPSWAHPGGVRWKSNPSSVSRHTCSNAPAAQLAAGLYETTQDPRLCRWSVRIYDWVRSALRRTGNLYVDNLLPDGTLDQTLWSYNQGTMIGAGTQLYRATGERQYLDQSVASAEASVREFSVPALVQQEPAFNAIYFRNLLLLDQVAPNSTYRDLVRAYGEAMWVGRRDARSGLFRGEGSLLDNSASMLGIYALLAGAQPRP